MYKKSFSTDLNEIIFKNHGVNTELREFDNPSLRKTYIPLHRYDDCYNDIKDVLKKHGFKSQIIKMGTALDDMKFLSWDLSICSLGTSLPDNVAEVTRAYREKKGDFPYTMEIRGFRPLNGTGRDEEVYIVIGGTPFVKNKFKSSKF